MHGQNYLHINVLSVILHKVECINNFLHFLVHVDIPGARCTIIMLEGVPMPKELDTEPGDEASN